MCQAAASFVSLRDGHPLVWPHLLYAPPRSGRYGGYCLVVVTNHVQHPQQAAARRVEVLNFLAPIDANT